MFYTVYKITNIENLKIYIGVHKTSNLDDHYYGSGKLIKRAIEKYGIHSFRKEYLAIFDNAEEMFAMETCLVTEPFVNQSETYNLKTGGFGGFDFVNKTVTAEQKKIQKAQQVQKYKYENDPEYRARKQASVRNRDRTKYYEALKTRTPSRSFLGKTHTIETKKKISEANKSLVGERNSQFGSCWMIDPNGNTIKVRKDDVDLYISKGYIKGRKIKL